MVLSSASSVYSMDILPVIAPTQGYAIGSSSISKSWLIVDVDAALLVTRADSVPIQYWPPRSSQAGVYFLRYDAI